MTHDNENDASVKRITVGRFALRSGAAPAPTPQARSARVAVAALFFTNGVLFANVVPRYPEIKDRLDLSNAALGSALAAFPFGALLAGLFAAAIIGRWRSARVASGGIALLSVSFVLAVIAPSWGVLSLVFFVGGALDAVVDVAQNAHGLRVQRVYGRSIVNSFHGVWSIGAVTGGVMGSAAAGWSVPLAAHLTFAAVLFSAVAFGAYRFLLPGPDDSERVNEGEALAGVESRDDRTDRGVRRVPGAVWRLLLVFGALAACGALVEDAGASWGAVYLRDELGAAAATAGLAFVALQVAMTAGRLLGDRFVDRFGTRRVVRTGGVVVAVGMGIALVLPSTVTTLGGFLLAGLGVATLVPATMHSADELPALASGVGLMVVSWLLRVGFLLSPLVVGVVADASSLRVGLLTTVFAGVVMAGAGRVLVGREAAAVADVSATGG
jgi:MFS family permease